jgi:hypothetical protein
MRNQTKARKTQLDAILMMMIRTKQPKKNDPGYRSLGVPSNGDSDSDTNNNTNSKRHFSDPHSHFLPPINHQRIN